MMSLTSLSCVHATTHLVSLSRLRGCVSSETVAFKHLLAPKASHLSVSRFVAKPAAPKAAVTDETTTSDTAGASKSEAQKVTLPQPKNVKVKTAEYISSSVKLEQCPRTGYTEFAVIGRSNVGKSSLINMLTGKKALALVSKTPGKTKCINHFLINDSWYLVDLPGYGYAKKSKDDRFEWNKFTKDYFIERETLANVLLLIDASIPPQKIDIQCASWLGDTEVPFSLVFTKTDKRKKGVPNPKENMAAFEAELLKEWEFVPPTVVTSATTGAGRMELLQHIAQIREFYDRASKER